MTASTWAGAAGLRLAGAVRRVAACGLAAVSLAATAQAPSAAACPPVVSPPSADEIRSAQQAARDRGFLWRISKGGVTSYLYGTIHLGSLQWAPPGPTLLQALEQAQVMALELDVTDAETLSLLQAALEQASGQRCGSVPLRRCLRD